MSKNKTKNRNKNKGQETGYPVSWWVCMALIAAATVYLTWYTEGYPVPY